MLSYFVAPYIAIFMLSLQGSAAPKLSNSCKSTPSSPGWPTSEQWHAFNQSLGGQLLAPLPPAIVCDESSSMYSAPSCKALGASWFTGAFHVEDPVSLLVPNFQKDGCLPTALYNGTCNTKPYPQYVVKATNADYVAKTVKFASKHNVRLSIKNTGHDYLGRSTSPALSLWTHHLKGIEVHSSFVPKSSKPGKKGVPAITAAAGEQFGDIYAVTYRNNIMVIGGQQPAVGLGGWLTAGGHSPASPIHGLGVDNVLEMVMVTPAGEVLTVNENQNRDLFWAMKGGGGGTFGVLISATMKTYPTFPVQQFSITFSSTHDETFKNDNKNFFSALQYFFSKIPEISDAYGAGYFSMGPAGALGIGGDYAGSAPDPTVKPKKSRQAFTYGGHFLNQAAETMKELIGPIEKMLKATKGLKSEVTYAPGKNVNDLLGTDKNTAPAGYNSIVASRLWDKEILLNKTAMLSAFKTLQYGPSQGLLVTGPAVRDPGQIPLTSVTPAWRRSYLHLTSGGSWAYRNNTQRLAAVDITTNVLGKVLRDLGPDMGAYMNEANVYEPDRQQAFWGYENYDRLLRIKRRYDPNGVFWCRVCVGAEDWEVDKSTGQLCPIVTTES